MVPELHSPTIPICCVLITLEHLIQRTVVVLTSLIRAGSSCIAEHAYKFLLKLVTKLGLNVFPLEAHQQICPFGGLSSPY